MSTLTSLGLVSGRDCDDIVDERGVFQIAVRNGLGSISRSAGSSSLCFKLLSLLFSSLRLGS